MQLWDGWKDDAMAVVAAVVLLVCGGYVGAMAVSDRYTIIEVPGGARVKLDQESRKLVEAYRKRLAVEQVTAGKGE